MMDFDDIKFLLKAHWIKAWQRHTELPACQKRIEELHPSSFPYCGLRHSLELASSDGDNKTFNMSAEMEYYCSVGTVAHLIFQKHNRLLKGGGREVPVMVGDWTCPACQYKNKFRPYHTCKKCKSPAIQGEVARLSGDEISVQLGTRTTGHTDDVIMIDGRYWVVDYKTSSVRATQNYKKFNRGLPYKHNVHQIQSYVALLERKYNIKIAGWFLVYVARDSPAKEYAIVGEEIGEDLREELHRKIEIADKDFNVIRTHIAPAVNNRHELFKGDTEKVDRLTARLVKNKLCKSQEYYESNIKDPYDECPFSEVCFNGMVDRYATKVFLRVGNSEDEED